MMLPPSQIGHKDKSVIINKPALQAWLLAWTTGKSFLAPTSPGSVLRKPNSSPSPPYAVCGQT